MSARPKPGSGDTWISTIVAARTPRSATEPPTRHTIASINTRARVGSWRLDGKSAQTGAGSLRHCGMPERFAQEALGHNSKAVHRAYAKRALMRIPSLEDYERKPEVAVAAIASFRLFVRRIEDSMFTAASNKRWVSSFNFVNAAGLCPQDGAFVGLSNFPSFDRNHAGEELGKLRFGFF